MGFSNFGPFLHIGREPNTQQCVIYILVEDEESVA